MRRFFLILLLTILPLQASWAAVCAYCPDTCNLETEQRPAAGAQHDDEGATLMADDGCHCCQPGSVAIAPSLRVSMPIVTPSSHTDLPGALAPASFRPERPERPKWTRAA
jgi:hypothetical protein